MGEMADMALDQMSDPDEHGIDGFCPYWVDEHGRLHSCNPPRFKTCRHCGKTGLEWRYFKDNKWRLADSEGEHFCTLSLKEIVERMRKLKKKVTKVTKQTMKELLRTNIAGLQHGDIQKIDPKSIIPGTECKMFWERNNPYDPLAIRVELFGLKIGYIPKKLTHEIHICRDKGSKMRCEITGYFPTNPSWEMLHVRILNTEINRTESDIEL